MSEAARPCEIAQAGGWPVRDRAPGGVPIELTDAFPRFKAAINVPPGSNPAWSEVIERAVPLLALHSKDLGVAGELGVALWMDRRFSGLQDALTIWLDLLGDPIWPHTWPRARADRASQLQRFLARVEANLRDPSQRAAKSGDRAAQEGVVDALRRLEAEAVRQLEGASCTDEIRKLRRAILDLSGPTQKQPERTIASSASAEQLAAQLISVRDQLTETLTGPVSLEVVEPWWSALQNPLWQVLRAITGSWPGVPSAWRLARALAWCLESPPPSARGLIAMDARVAKDLAERAVRLPQVAGGAIWFDMEEIWQERGHVRWLDPHRVSAERLRRAGHGASALAVERTTAAWLERARGLAELRCDDEARTRLADEATRKWISRLTAPVVQSVALPPVDAPSYNAVTLTNSAEKLRKEVRGSLAKSGGAQGAGSLDVVAAIGLLKAPMDALIQLLCALDPTSPVTASLALTWPDLQAAVQVLARGESRPGATALEPPDEALIWALEQSGADSLLRVVELWTAIAAHPWWLDLHRALAETLTQAGGLAAAAVVADCAEELTLAWPDLLGGRFTDGRPWADEATRAWLSGLGARAEPAPSSTIMEVPSSVAPPRVDPRVRGSAAEALSQRDAATEDEGDPWAPGLQLIADGQVGDGLDALERVSRLASGGRQRFEGALRVAEELLGAGQHDAAEAILGVLDVVARRQHLDAWEPALAEAVTRARWRLIAERSDAADRTLPDDATRALLRRAASQGLYGLLRPSS